jgi:hypothetical protein
MSSGEGQILGPNRLFVGILLSVTQDDYGEVMATFDTDRKIPTVLRLPDLIYNGQTAFPTMDKLLPMVGTLMRVGRIKGRYYVAPGGVR